MFKVLLTKIGSVDDNVSKIIEAIDGVEIVDIEEDANIELLYVQPLKCMAPVDVYEVLERTARDNMLPIYGYIATTHHVPGWVVEMLNICTKRSKRAIKFFDTFDNLADEIISRSRYKLVHNLDKLTVDLHIDKCVISVDMDDIFNGDNNIFVDERTNKWYYSFGNFYIEYSIVADCFMNGRCFMNKHDLKTDKDF